MRLLGPRRREGLPSSRRSTLGELLVTLPRREARGAVTRLVARDSAAGRPVHSTARITPASENMYSVSLGGSGWKRVGGTGMGTTGRTGLRWRINVYRS